MQFFLGGDRETSVQYHSKMLPCSKPFVLLFCLAFIVSKARGQVVLQCALPQQAYNLLDDGSLTFSQEIRDNEISIQLTYRGIGWLGFGFSKGSMVGSTVVIGLPDVPNQEGVNPVKYYLGSKNTRGILSFGDKPGSTNGGENPEWRRELQGHRPHRTLQIENAKIQQNETHTTMEFTRPFESSGGTVLPVYENEYNTFIYAAGTSNTLGYHGSIRGNRSMEFAVEACPPSAMPTTLPPTLAPSETSPTKVDDSSKQSEVLSVAANDPKDMDDTDKFGSTAAARMTSTLVLQVFLLFSALLW